MSALPHIFLEQIIAIVGTEYVSTRPEKCAELARTTLPQSTTPSGVVRPANRKEVQQILRCAAEHRIALYPISCGKNWGYGDACAPKDGMLILDLSRMNRILEVNAELAYAVIEPGVTQGQLNDYLAKEKLPLMLDGNGAGPDASYVGNVLERGFGHSAYGDRFSHSCNLEAILADGTILHTGFGAYPQAQAQHVYKHGMGPSLDGLLTQSNFAVITRMTIWLLPRPEHFNFFFIALKTDDAIGPMVDVLRRLRLAGTLRGNIHCFNDRRALSNLTRFPYALADGKGALETAHPDLMRKLYRQFNVSAWALTGVLEGSPAEVAAGRKTLRRAVRGMRGLGKLVFLGPWRFRWVYHLSAWLRKVPVLRDKAAFFEKVQIAIDLLRGQPSSLTLDGAHWRSRGVPGIQRDPLDSHAGLIWISPVMPMTGQAIRDFKALSEPLFHEFGFEYQVTLTCLNERALCAVTTIAFDRDSQEETERAARCSDKLLNVLLEKGYIPYRSSPVMGEKIRQAFPEQWRSMTELKKAWDPQGIIAPGRYLQDTRGAL